MKILSRRPEKMEKKIYDTIRPAEVSPLFIKVRPFLRVCAFSLRFPAENFRMVKFSAGKTLRKRRNGREEDSEGENCDRRSACVTKQLFRSLFSCRNRHETACFFLLRGRLSCSLCIACGWVLQPAPAFCRCISPILMLSVSDYISACCHVRCRKMKKTIYRTIHTVLHLLT
jgi:hypothetical protein